MSIVVNTSVWSLALRRRRASTEPEAHELAALIRERCAFIIGPIRQELLSGVPAQQQYETLREYLQPCPDRALKVDGYEEAAAFFNRCRARGIQGSNSDFLICATAVRRKFAILTIDADFSQFARVLPIQLHTPRKTRSG